LHRVRDGASRHPPLREYGLPNLHRSAASVHLQRLCADDSQAETAVGLYRERFAVTGLFENEVYSGIPEMLAALNSSALYVCTSKPTVYAERIIEYFGLRRYVAKVYGSELDGARSDKAELIAWLLEQERLTAPNCTMVGDRLHDIVGARQNCVAAYGALWGYGSEKELLDAGAERVFSRPSALAELLRTENEARAHDRWRP
jgi:phosphoglycolate phosphatase